MKLALQDLKKMIQWIEINTNDLFVHLNEDGHKMIVKCTDKHDRTVTIELYEDNNLLPRISKTEVLR